MQARLDKWVKMTSCDENNTVINHFLDKPEFRVLVISQSSAGVLQPVNSFPATIKGKTVYFVKRLSIPLYSDNNVIIINHFLCRSCESIHVENFKSNVMCGEMSTIPLEQLTTIVDKVCWLVCEV